MWTFFSLPVLATADEDPLKHDLHRKRRREDESLSATPKSTISLSSKKYSRGSLLPVEYDLERLIQNISNPHPSWKSSTPACEWRGIKCSDSFSEIRSSENAYEQQGTFQGTTHYGESAPKHKRTKGIQVVTSIAWGLYEIEMSHNPKGPLFLFF